VTIQALVAQLPVEALDEGILHRFARSNEIEAYVMRVRPGVHGPAHKLAAVVDGDCLRRPTPLQDLAERARDLDAGKRSIGDERERLERVEVEHGQGPKPTAIDQTRAHEIHTPPLIRPRRGRQRHARPTGQLPPRLRAHLESL
jgi:hypothetical protein